MTAKPKEDQVVPTDILGVSMEVLKEASLLVLTSGFVTRDILEQLKTAMGE